VKKQISAVFVAAALAVLAACGSAPTASDAAAPAGWQANDVPSEAPQDTTGRVPNMMGSGN
jgi:predicted small lipoprotein YifL